VNSPILRSEAVVQLELTNLTVPVLQMSASG